MVGKCSVSTYQGRQSSVIAFSLSACDCYNQGTVTPLGHNPVDPLPCDDEGKCTCLRNVIGEKCDGCQDTYWNVGSGYGCEECLCDPIGSLNDSCDITGQCPCKPGVTGRVCDLCESDHYSFSKDGCLRKYYCVQLTSNTFNLKGKLSYHKLVFYHVMGNKDIK